VRVYDVGGDGRSVTVLIADDNDVALRLCRRVLQKAGYEVLTATDGLEAVSVALANSPDLILMDVAMPGIDGLEATRQIKKQRPGIAIVIASVLATASNRERFLASGADDVLMPPFRLSDLIAAVARLTANRGPQMKDVTGTRLGSHEIVEWLGGGIADVPTQPYPAAVSAPPPPPPQVSPDGKFYWDGTWAPIPERRQPGQLSPDGKYYWDGERWVPEALMAEEGFVTRVRVPNTPRFYWDGQRWVPEALAPRKATVTGVPVPEQARDLDGLAADLEAVWNRVESGQLALGEPNEDLYSLFETLIAGLRAPRAGNGSGPSPRMRALLRAKHRPVIQTFLGRKYEDDEGLAVAAWDGTVRLGCRCGWRDSRIEAASTAPASTGSLSDAWREHVMADMAGVEYRGSDSPDSGFARPSP
jgi:two-component system cell cycle response regulator DivK